MVLNAFSATVLDWKAQMTDTIEAAADKFATSDHIDNDLGIATRYPNTRFTFKAGAHSRDEEVRGLREALRQGYAPWTVMKEAQTALRQCQGFSAVPEYTINDALDSISGQLDGKVEDGKAPEGKG